MTSPTVLITGASRGIGAATARFAAELGANVILNARSEADLAPAAQRIAEAGGEALSAPGDVSQRDDCHRIVRLAVERFGRLDAIVNNAATLEPLSSIAASTPEAWQRALAVNVLGPLMLAQAAMGHLRSQRGRIIHVTSGAASFPITGLSAYCASKAALNMLNQTLAKEESELTVIAFDPGTVDTDMHALVRAEGGAVMSAAEHAMFLSFQQKGELISPDVPGRLLAHLALRAPHDWSGSIVAWDDERVQSLAGAGAAS